MKKTIYSLALITLAIACPHIGNAMDNNNPPNLNPLKRLFSEVSPDQTSSSTSQNEQNRNKFRRIQNRPTETTNTPNLSQQQTPFAPQPQQNPAPTTLVQPQIIQNIAQQSQQNNTSRLISLLLAFLSNPQTNNTTNFSIFQAPITLQQINPQSFFEPQRFLTPQNTLNWLFLQTSPEPQQNIFQPNFQQAIPSIQTNPKQNLQLSPQQNMQPTVQSPATPSLPSNFNNLVKKLYSAIENDDVKQTETLLKKQPANVVKALLESKDKNSRSTPLHNAMNQSNDMITLLLKYGAPIIATDKCSDTPFQCCIEHHTFLTNLQTNNTTNFNTFQAPITQPQFTPQRFFEPQLQNTLNGLFLQTSPVPQQNIFQPNFQQAIPSIQTNPKQNLQLSPQQNMQPTVQSPATPPLPSYYFDRLVRNLFSAIRNNDVEKTVSILKNQPANVVKCLLESKEKNSKNSPLHAAIYCSEAMTTLLLKYGAPTTATDICGDTPLQCCIQHYLMNTIPLPLNIIKLFLDKDPSAISSSNNEGDTLLHSVCKSYNPNQTAAIELLLSYGALVTTPSKSYNRYTPFHLLIRACNTETKESLNMITKFLTIAPNLITTRDEIGSTPLHQAAANGLLETVKLFIQKGAKIDEPDYQGLTPLHEASRNGCLEIVTLLVQKGAKIDASTHQNLNNHSGNTPLHLASENGRLETIIFLIEHGAQVDERTAENQTSLHLAINSNNLETVLLLIKNGANVNAKDNNGVTPIHIATEKINLGIVMNLIAQGAKIDEPTTKNITPLLQAAQRTLRIFQNEKYLNENMTKIIQTLIDHGATTICKTVKHLNTALHLLVQSNNLDAIKILAKKKVLNNVQNLDGETPLHIIASKLANNAHSIEIAPQIIQILIDNGATINLQNKKKFTPLQCAVRSNGRRPAFTLIENGATIEFIINKTLNKPYKRNLPIVLSAFFKTLLKPEKSATDCALEKSPKWLEDDNALAQAYHSNKKITAETNLLMSTKNSLLRKLTFCLFFTAEEIYKLKISLDPKNPFKKLLTLTTEEYKLYMELFNSDPKEKRIRTLLGLLTTSKDVKILIQRLKKETVNSTPFDATKKVGSTKHDICIKFTPQDAWFIEKK